MCLSFVFQADIFYTLFCFPPKEKSIRSRVERYSSVNYDRDIGPLLLLPSVYEKMFVCEYPRECILAGIEDYMKETDRSGSLCVYAGVPLAFFPAARARSKRPQSSGVGCKMPKGAHKY